MQGQVMDEEQQKRVKLAVDALLRNGFNLWVMSVFGQRMITRFDGHSVAINLRDWLADKPEYRKFLAEYSQEFKALLKAKSSHLLVQWLLLLTGDPTKLGAVGMLQPLSGRNANAARRTYGKVERQLYRFFTLAGDRVVNFVVANADQFAAIDDALYSHMQQQLVECARLPSTQSQMDETQSAENLFSPMQRLGERIILYLSLLLQHESAYVKALQGVSYDALQTEASLLANPLVHFDVKPDENGQWQLSFTLQSMSESQATQDTMQALRQCIMSYIQEHVEAADSQLTETLPDEQHSFPISEALKADLKAAYENVIATKQQTKNNSKKRPHPEDQSSPYSMSHTHFHQRPPSLPTAKRVKHDDGEASEVLVQRSFTVP